MIESLPSPTNSTNVSFPPPPFSVSLPPLPTMIAFSLPLVITLAPASPCSDTGSGAPDTSKSNAPKLMFPPTPSKTTDSLNRVLSAVTSTSVTVRLLTSS